MMSSALEQDLDAPQAPRAGADLRAARERVGWSLSQMADALRIRYQYLEALEDGRINELPGNAYALGFMRTYATALGLDPNEIARRFRAEAAEVNQQTVLTFPVPVPARGVPAGAVVLLGVMLAVGVYVGWYRLSGEGRLPAETSAPIPAQLAPLATTGRPAVDRGGRVGRAGPGHAIGWAGNPVPARAGRGRSGSTAGRHRGGGTSRAGDFTNPGRRGPGSGNLHPPIDRPGPHRATRERRCLGPGARPQRHYSAQPYPACG